MFILPNQDETIRKEVTKIITLRSRKTLMNVLFLNKYQLTMNEEFANCIDLDKIDYNIL